MNKRASRLITTLAALALGLVAMALVPAVFQRAWVYANPGPDLRVESITISPSAPELSQTVYITVVTRNIGNAAAIPPPGQTYSTGLYIDPSDQPPVAGTKVTYPFIFGTSLPAGGYFANSRTHVFTTTGCNHVVYAWADAGQKIAEDDETNNVRSATICVGVQGVADSYEPDNTCGASRWVTSTQGLFPQAHTLWPQGDDDWVKFSAVAGVSYTIQATNLETHADPQLYLLNSCSSLAQFGTGPRIDWRAPSSGLYYIWAADGYAKQGPLTGYSLTVSADTSGLYDPYEPDDSCTAARDISTDGSPQTHYFQTMGDVDWVKFPIVGGETYIVVADNTGTGVSPNVALYGTCTASFGGPMAQGIGALQVEAAAPGVLYGKVTNAGAGYGISATYNLRVNTVSCAPDGQEPDDTSATARTVEPNALPKTHTTCPAGDQDWAKFTASSGATYVLETSNLGPAADTEIVLYGTDQTTELARNDDYTSGLLNSRIVWSAPAAGTYYARIHHVKAQAAGANTRYDFAITQGACKLDAFENADLDNGPIAAPELLLGGENAQAHNLCPVGDQDWARFQGIQNTPFVIQTSNLSAGGDTMLYLYGPGGALLASNDDFGPGGASSISYTLPTAGTYYVQAISFDTNNFGTATEYSLTVQADIPPTPTPSPTPTRTPTPTPVATPPPSSAHTLILVNRQRIEDLYDANASWQLMDKLYEYAARPEVAGLVAQVEFDPSVATAYAAWTLNESTMLSTTLANNVAGAVRNLVLAHAPAMSAPRRLVIVGDDRAIPFRRVTDFTSKKENQYAASMTVSTTQWASAVGQMILTDDYYADLAPGTWTGGELYLPDFSVGRLVETPSEIIGVIDAYLARNGLVLQNALVTGYSFVGDTANTINIIAGADSLNPYSLIGEDWESTDLAARQFQNSPRYDIQSINGHATHSEQRAPDESAVTSTDVASSTTDLAGAVIYTVGCHSGLNDSGSLDLAQAFAQKGASYVANTGYGWGGGGTTYSEALMRNLTLSLLSGISQELGDALMRAKATYYYTGTGQSPNSYDHKVLAESVLYGLPTWVITTGATFADEDPFPGVVFTPTLPGGSFGSVTTGTLSFGLQNFGAFDPVTQTQGYFGEGSFYTLNGNVQAAAGEPIQPRLFANLSAPAAGTLRSVVFLGGVYTDIQGFDPVIVLPFNEYVTDTTEPAFDAPGWFPPVPFGVHNSAGAFGGADMLVTTMGQFNSDTGIERLYTNMSFGSSYSSDPDIDPPVIQYVGGVLLPAAGKAYVKVQASDDTAVGRVVVAFTQGDGVWKSQDLTYTPGLAKWTGEITATIGTLYFVQALDAVGNMEVAHNKGAYYSVQPPAPLVAGEGFRRAYLPLVVRGN